MKYISAILVALALIFGTWYVASPYYSLSGLRDAAVAGDADGLEDHVDFASLRVSMKSEFKSKLKEEAAKEDANPFLATAGLLLADRIVDGMLDNMMTPDGIAQMIKISQDKTENAGNIIAQGDPKKADDKADDKFDDWEVERIGLSQFRLSDPTNENTPVLIFERDGLGWKLSDVDMRDVELPSLR